MVDIKLGELEATLLYSVHRRGDNAYTFREYA
jgi:hypothetical protein